jgi:uncharacterized protein
MPKKKSAGKCFGLYLHKRQIIRSAAISDKSCLRMKAVKVLGITYNETSQSGYTLVLAEIDGNRRIPIVIGPLEAQAIAIGLEKMKTQRPLTHDLFVSFAKAFSITVDHVLISKVKKGVFYSILFCKLGEESYEIDARTSDAVALALRFDCPMFASDEVLNAEGIDRPESLAEETDEAEGSKGIAEEDSELSYLSDEELEELLAEAVKNEEFEKASWIRDEINKRRKKNE